MSSNYYQYAFIGVMFCIVCVWATMFVTEQDTALKIYIPSNQVAICVCENSPLFLSINSVGLITYKSKVVSTEDVLTTLQILHNDGWRYGVDITASSELEHKAVVDLTSNIKSHFKDISIVWRSNET